MFQCRYESLVAYQRISRKRVLAPRTVSYFFTIGFDESDYTKVQSSICVSGQGYPTLNGAKVACSLETGCVGVLDEKCGNTTNSYFVCSNDLEMGVNIDSCVHKKTTSKGMEYLLHVQIVATKIRETLIHK